MFEPIHGSAPKYTGKNVINPIAAICAMQMLLETIGEHEGAQLVDQAVAGVLSSGRLKDLSTRSGMKTNEIGDLVVESL